MKNELSIDIILKYKNAKIKTNIGIYDVLGVLYNTNELILRSENSTLPNKHYVKIEHCKILLYDIKDIVYEHRKMLNSILEGSGLDEFNAFSLGDAMYFIERIESHIYGCENFVSVKQWIEAIDYLRYNNYDIDQLFKENFVEIIKK